ncbi:amidohydrolase [Agromyces sp. ZXT2-6]|uniref:amidohydrolase n=1 Tax=Agromyces sp. ZXT2-6 TaxID=3461153 RepID=UPI004054BABF
MSQDVHARLAAAIDELPLVDHHAHGMLTEPLTDADLLDALTQADRAADADAVFDSQLGFALRRHCAPVLGLEPCADAAAYLAARRELGFEEATTRLLRAAGVRDYLIDDGHAPDRLMPDERMARLADARTHRVARLETLAERALADATSGADFVERLEAVLDTAAAEAIAFKTVAAYRGGLALAPTRPPATDLASAADAWFAASARTGSPPRLEDPTIIGNLAWWALERGAVLQVHVGFGDGDVRLDRAHPSLLQPFVAATQRTGGRIALLHCHPFTREAGMLAHVYPHVFLDAGLAIPFVGANADVLVRETLDVAPFSKVLFSSDAWGVPERVHLGARLWRDAAARVLSAYVTRGDWRIDDAVRVAERIAWRNAAALYGPAVEA